MSKSGALSVIPYPYGRRQPKRFFKPILYGIETIKKGEKYSYFVS